MCKKVVLTFIYKVKSIGAEIQRHSSVKSKLTGRNLSLLLVLYTSTLREKNEYAKRRIPPKNFPKCVRKYSLFFTIYNEHTTA